MVICFSKTITRGSWGTIRTGLSPRKQKSRLIRAIGYAELKVRGQKKSVSSVVLHVKARSPFELYVVRLARVTT